ncbi:MAG: ZIP family metal transporter [Candidatus Aenigmarchaeota archaeon]|nr:ZIP family metal transporter [Candidatus Aenigmarchaeota archaeon]
MAMYAEILQSFESMNVLEVSIYAGVFVALMTSFGSLFAVFTKKLKHRSFELSLSFAAGVMIVASFTSLILPAIEYSKSFLPVGIGILLGVILIDVINRLVPHEHLVKGYEGPKEMKGKLKVAWLIVLAVIIHNFPEGLAVGTSLVYSVSVGLVTALAIGIQDIPEGTLVSLPLTSIQKKRTIPILMGVLSGIAEGLMVVVGALFFNYFKWFLPYGLSLAGGAMLYVTVKEMIPEIYGKEKDETLITLGFFLGFYVMLFLDSML